MNDEVRELSLVHSIETFYTGGSVEWSVDGHTIFTTCSNVVKALNIDDGTTRYVLGDVDDTSHVTCAQCTPDAHSMIVAYANSLLREYILPRTIAADMKAEMNRQWKSTHTAPIKIIKFSANAALIGTGAADFTLKVWKLESQCCIASLKGPTAVTEALFVDGDRILVGYMDGTVNFYRLKGDKKLIHCWKNHTSQVVSILQLERTIAATVSRDQTIALTNIETKEKIKTLPLFEPVESALLTDDGTMVTVGEEGILKCWQPTSGKLLRSADICRCRIDLVLRDRIRGQLLLASCDSNLYLVDENTLDVSRQMVGFNDEIFDLAFVGPNQRYMMVAANSTDIRMYETRSWACHLVPGHMESVLCVVNSSWDANVFATSSKDNSFIVWRISDEQKVNTPRKMAIATGHTNNVTAIRFSNTSKRHFIVSVSNDTTLKLWSLADVKPTSECVKLSAASTLVAHTKDVTCVDVSVNDRLCVTGSMDKTAKLWHIDPSKMQLGIAGTLAGHRRGVWDARFSATTQIVATCCGDCMVRVFSLNTRECIATLNGHPSAVLKVIFVNNDKQLISADSGGLLKIWSISAKECLSTMEAHNDKIWTMLAYADESRFVTAGSDGRIRVWEDVTEKKREEEEQKRSQRIRDEQKLTNLIEQKRYAEALSFSLTLSRPYNCLKIVNVLMAVDNGLELRTAIANLLEDQLIILLDFASQWNTNSRTSAASQRVLYEVLHCYRPEQLLKAPNFAAVVESFIPYTNRHFERLTRSRQNAAFLHYTWSRMRLSDTAARTT